MIWCRTRESRPARGRAWTARARLEAVITTAALDEAGKNAWCRQHGVYPAELDNWTYVPTDEGWLYVALVLDMYARKLVGWAMSETMHQELTQRALDAALGWREPDEALIHHSDRGYKPRGVHFSGASSIV